MHSVINIVCNIFTLCQKKRENCIIFVLFIVPRSTIFLSLWSLSDVSAVCMLWVCGTLFCLSSCYFFMLLFRRHTRRIVCMCVGTRFSVFLFFFERFFLFLVKRQELGLFFLLNKFFCVFYSTTLWKLWLLLLYNHLFCSGLFIQPFGS